DGEEKLYSEKMACVNCGINVPPLEPRSFSFNSAYGACRHCHGLGTVLEIDPAKLIPNPGEMAERLPFMDAADKAGSAYLRSALLAVITHFKANPKNLFAELPAEVREAFFHGAPVQLKFKQGLYSYKSPWRGAVPWLRERLDEAPSEKVRLAIEEMVSPTVCAVCDGRRLRTDSLAVRVGGRGIADYTSMTIADAIKACDQI